MRKCDLSDFHYGMIVGARWAQTRETWDFHAQNLYSLQEGAVKTVQWQFCEGKHLVDERGPLRMARLV